MPNMIYFGFLSFQHMLLAAGGTLGAFCKPTSGMTDLLGHAAGQT
jgi:hypothetical protein